MYKYSKRSVLIMEDIISYLKMIQNLAVTKFNHRVESARNIPNINFDLKE